MACLPLLSETGTRSRPGPSPLSPRFSEALRSRELYRYYQPPSSNSSTSTAVGLSHQGPITSNDPSLVAYAQLTAIRLNCHRCMISLIDETKQYIIAECTQTVSPLSATDHETGDEIWLGGAEIIPRFGGLCENTVMLEQAIRTTSNGSSFGHGDEIDTEMGFYDTEADVDTLPMYEVEDLSKSAKFCEFPYVKEAPALRYYCGVPLRTRKGFHIGSLCVVDSKARKLDDTEKRMLRWMANTVMQHLEMVADKKALKRVQEMQISLSRFAVGEWSKSSGIETPRAKINFKQGVKRTKSSINQNGNYENDQTMHQGSTKAYTNGRLHELTKSEQSFPEQNNLPVKQRPSVVERNSSTSSTGSLSSKQSKQSTTSDTSVESLPRPPLLKSVDKHQPVPEISFKNTFARACTFMRDALELDGIVFTDAEKNWTDQAPLDIAASPIRDRSSGHRQSYSIGSVNGLNSPYRASKKVCSIIAYAMEQSTTTPEYSSKEPSPLSDFNTDFDSDIVGKLPEHSLHSLFTEYPQGQIFSYDSHGNSKIYDQKVVVEGPETSEPDDEHVELVHDRDRVLSDVLFFLPDCKSCIFVPLYDHSGKAFAACFAWTKSATRVFLQDEFNYVVAFTNSIMLEMGRIELGLADKAKGNFISSISHELRSPLHGILASAEFLSDTTLDTFQGSLVETVESCGRTLLDTINHVLDFSKLNSLQNDASRDNPSKKRRSRNKKKTDAKIADNQALGSSALSSPGLNVVTEINIAAVTEEVVEGVFAGYEFRGINTIAMMENSSDSNIVPLQPETIGPTVGNSRASSRDVTPVLTGKKDDISVIFEIERRDNWMFAIQPGAFRRVLMNVFGNALKYTDRGFVRVRLQAEPYESSDDSDTENGELEYEDNRTLVTLTVQDSGRGISREFLKTKLFTPFSQENALASGAGLGMSIVRQIVEILGGKIDVSSELGVGTEIKITFVLEHDPELGDNFTRIGPSPGMSEEEDDNQDVLAETQRKAKGKRIAVLGFDTGSSDLIFSEASRQLRSSFEQYAREWYNMTVVSPIPGATILDYKDKADVILANESTDLLQQLQFKGAKPPTIVLCSNAARYGMYTSQADQGGIIDFASKPCGPYKLSKALYFCFNQTEFSRRSSSSSGRSTLTITGIRNRPPLDRGKSFQVVPSTSTVREEEVESVGSVRLSPPVRTGSSASEPVVYVPGIGMMATNESSSVVPVSTGRRRSVTVIDDPLHAKGTGEKVPIGSVTSNSTTTSQHPKLGAHFASLVAVSPIGMTAPALGVLEDDTIDRPAFASPVVEKENPLRPRSWNHWQSLNASADASIGSSETVASLGSVLEAQRKPSTTQAPMSVPIMNAGDPVTSTQSSLENVLPTVLIVEDNPINLMLLATFMTKKKYPFQKAENGLLALQAFEKMPNGFDVVIMDIQMPVMSGLESTAAIRELERRRGSKTRATIVALTGLAAADDQREAYDCGVDFFVTKPISMKKIEQHLKGREVGNSSVSMAELDSQRYNRNQIEKRQQQRN